jgi:hypothetical protein
MKIICHTNLDLIYEVWPTELPCVPRVEEEIQSKIKHGDFILSLQVVKVRYVHFKNNEWIPHIELHMTEFQKRLTSINADTGSITAFYEWYAPLVNRSVSSFI